jgi:hypothetical protein
MIRSLPQRKTQLRVETLECRYAPADLTVPMIPELDQFGDQIAAYQSYGSSDITESIFDTGASAITFAPDAQDYLQIPIKIPGGAVASGIGGEITGDVSMPGTVMADGLHAVDLSSLFDIFNFDFSLNTTLNPATAASMPGVQAFVGTSSGSPNLPTITGTPILNPSPANPNGLAAKIEMQGYSFDVLAGLSSLLPEFTPGELTWELPDLHFVQPGTAPSIGADTTAPVYVPMSLYGFDNHLDPGDAITDTPSPYQTDVGVVYKNTSPSLNGLDFLFDTGAQLSVISTATALALGIDLAHPETTITVGGVGGNLDVPGFTLDRLDVPTTTGDKLIFTDVPVYVLDVAPDLDGILGMNLFNTANSIVYDPFNPDGSRVGLTFHTTPRDTLPPDDPAAQSLLNSLLPFYGSLITGRSLPGIDASKATTTNLTSSVNPALNGAPVTLTATIPQLTDNLGTVTFFDNGVPLSGTSTVAVVGGVAQLTISSLSPGQHSITAVYSGANGFAGSTSNLIVQAVNVPTTTTVVGTPQATTGGSLIQFTATVSSTPTANVGTVDFLDNGVPISGGTNVTVNNGVAQFSTTSIVSLGSHSITAVYSGDAAAGFLGSTSSPFTQSIVGPGTLVGSKINGGSPGLDNLPTAFANQRSMVRSVQLTFSSPVTLAADAVSLAVHNNPLVANPTLPGSIIVRNSSNGTSADSTWVITFAGANVVGGSIGDGEYDLLVDRLKVTNALGQHPATAPAPITFYRLLGDADGNRTVNNLDIVNVRKEFGKTQAAPNYLWLFDTDWNGSMNNIDVVNFRRNFGRAI